MPFKMHNFIWGMQQPQWIDSLTTTDQTTAIIDWISNVGARYPDMDCIDVVNEPFHNPPSYIKAMGGNGSTGWDWVVFAYKLARKYCPKAKLLLNEYNLERSPAFCAEFTNLVMILKASNLIDGIGLQSHNKDIAGISRETFSNSLSVLASTGLPIYISELDLSGPVDSIQLDQYKKYFPMLWNYPAVKGITLWGYIDGEMWTSDAGLLEPDGKEREALTWLTNYVRTAH
jgi:endo-1,4-beta-xylanase